MAVNRMTISTKDRSVTLSGDQLRRGVKAIDRKLKGQGELTDMTPPTLEEAQAAWAAVEDLQGRYALQKQHVKDLMEDAGLVEAIKQAKELKDQLAEARACWDQVGRRLQLGLTNVETGEVLS